MILTGSAIEKCVNDGEIVINPFENKNLNPNSYNFRLGDYVHVYQDHILDSMKEQEMVRIDIGDEGLILEPNILYLGYTQEKIGSHKYVPIINGRSSTGRLGLFVHITSNLIDIGDIGHYTLQMHVVQPLKIYKNMIIGQVTFWKPYGEIKFK